MGCLLTGCHRPALPCPVVPGPAFGPSAYSPASSVCVHGQHSVASFPARCSLSPTLLTSRGSSYNCHTVCLPAKTSPAPEGQPWSMSFKGANHRRHAGGNQGQLWDEWMTATAAASLSLSLPWLPGSSGLNQGLRAITPLPRFWSISLGQINPVCKSCIY